MVSDDVVVVVAAAMVFHRKYQHRHDSNIAAVAIKYYLQETRCYFSSW